jgi:hypothetical protein
VKTVMKTNGNESRSMNDLEAELALLLSMSKEERDVAILTETVAQEQAWYDSITEEWRQDKSKSDVRREHAGRVKYWKARLNAAKQKQPKSE